MFHYHYLHLFERERRTAISRQAIDKPLPPTMTCCCCCCCRHSSKLSGAPDWWPQLQPSPSPFSSKLLFFMAYRRDGKLQDQQPNPACSRTGQFTLSYLRFQVSFQASERASELFYLYALTITYSDSIRLSSLVFLSTKLRSGRFSFLPTCAN